MSDLRQAAQQALEALELCGLTDTHRSYEVEHAARTALRAALAQQEQEPVAWTDRELELLDGMIEVQLRHAAQCDAIANRPMAERQKGWDMERVALLRKIKNSPPRRETEQEPVARMHADGSGRIISQATYDEAQRQGGVPWSSVRRYTTPLYTTPPRREWQSLSEEEIQLIHDTYHKRMGPQEFARAIEAKLKERNNG